MKNPNQIGTNNSRNIPAFQEPGWEEVAFIDFCGYLDRDCEERVIYKTPDGKLKAARHSTGEAEVIEDVTREQVTRWIAQCVIPEEFEKDFAPLGVKQASSTTEPSQLTKITREVNSI